MSAIAVPLTRGFVTFVDDADADLVLPYRWHVALTERNVARPYAVRGIRTADGTKRKSYMHRELMGLSCGDLLTVDHIDFDTLNNRRSNLRVVAMSVNAQHRQPMRGSSKYIGVYYCDGRWRASIKVNRKAMHVGSYATEEEAALARDAFVRANGLAHTQNFITQESEDR